MTGTGLAVKQTADETTGTGLVAKHSQQGKLAGLLPCSMEVGGGSAVVLATRKVGSDLPYCLPPNLSPLPVSVHTHSLNLSKIQFSPTFLFFLLSPYKFVSLTPFIVSVRLTYPVS